MASISFQQLQVVEDQLQQIKEAILNLEVTINCTHLKGTFRGAFLYKNPFLFSRVERVRG